LDVISNTPLTPEGKVPDTWKAEFKSMTDKALMAKCLKFGSYIIVIKYKTLSYLKGTIPKCRKGRLVQGIALR